MQAVKARLRIDAPVGSCACTIVLPHSLLQALRQELSCEPAGHGAAADPRWMRQMEAGIRRAQVSVAAVIEMTLGDVAGFSVGKVLSLRGDGMGRVRLECSGRGIFWARLGQGEGRYGLEIEQAIEEDGLAIGL
jgi:flagellar motor switch protein FliM